MNILTIDLEEWFQASSLRIPVELWDKCESRICWQVNKILNLLSIYNAKATFFVSGWVADRNKALIEKITQQGHEIASHGYLHDSVYKYDSTAFRKDIEKSLITLKDVTGNQIIGYRAPNWGITKECFWALEVLREMGIKYDSSLLYWPDRDQKNYFKKSYWNIIDNLIELPPSVFRLGPFKFPFAGGIYLRLYPYMAIKKGIRKLNREGCIGIVYLHSWEIDPMHPFVRVSVVRNFIHYYNLVNAEKRLIKLLQKFSFTSIKERLFNDGQG